MHLFRISKENFISPSYIQVSGEDARHIQKSLRKCINDIFFASDETYIYECRITQQDKSGLKANIVNKKPAELRQKLSLTLYLSLIKFQDFETAIDAAAQLGVKTIIPMVAEYSQFRTIPENKYKRWQTILQESAKQCFNPVLPKLRPLIPFEQAISAPGCNILFHPYGTKTLKQALHTQICDFNIYIGPEAGFSEKEIKLAEQNKMSIVNLPFNLLTCPTAVLTALAGIILHYD